MTVVDVVLAVGPEPGVSLLAVILAWTVVAAVACAAGTLVYALIRGEREGPPADGGG